jgi:beta-glucosidase
MRGAWTAVFLLLPLTAPAEQSIDQRVDALIKRMTLEEKVGQMQDRAPAIPRLGVPAYEWWNEGLHGVAFAGNATNFPQVIGMAATWDTPLVHHMAEIISTEARAKYNEAVRVDDHESATCAWFPHPNTTPCTVAPSLCGTGST